MKLSRYIFIAIALLTFSTFAYNAHSQSIPFCVCYEDGLGTCNINDAVSDSEGPELVFSCQGPWFRLSKNIKMKPGDSVCPFYTAEVTTFSPYGIWNCTTQTPDLLNLIAAFRFKLTKDDKNIDLIITSDSITANVPSDPMPSFTATANLGDDNKRPKRDRDTFSFNFGPTPGDGVVKVTLEENPESGHAGEEATLILRSGNSNIEVNSGKLPLEITQELPGDGEYKLIVEQHGIPEELRFRGKYFLTVESDSGEIEEIRPSFDVEQ